MPAESIYLRSSIGSRDLHLAPSAAFLRNASALPLQCFYGAIPRLHPARILLRGNNRKQQIGCAVAAGVNAIGLLR